MAKVVSRQSCGERERPHGRHPDELVGIVVTMTAAS